MQMVPNEVGAHHGMDGSFTVLGFQDPEDPSLLYAEYPTGAVHMEKPNEVNAARLALRASVLGSTAQPKRLGSLHAAAGQ